MNPEIETEDWKLGAWIEWREKYKTEQCPYCFGSGTVGGGFKDLDGPQQCSTCWGTGFVKSKITSPKPELPVKLVEHMRRAWFDYIHNTKE